MKKIRATLIGVSLTAMLAVSPLAQTKQLVTIGTGGVTGIYYPAGGAICRLINKDRKEHGIRCFVESTDGSVYNINSIRSGEIDLGVVQSDWQHHAYNGSSLFEAAGPFQELRALFSLHPEPFTVVARADADIKTFNDLRDKRVNVGNPGSGQRATLEVLMAVKGWTMDDFVKISELQSADQSKALCDNEIDAMVFTVGHPSGSIKEATTSCNSLVVEVADAEVEKLVADNTFYRMATIPGGMYNGTTSDVSTFGVGATFVSSTKVSENTVYTIVKSVFENFDEFKKLHPAFANLKKEEMITNGFSAPLHPGAEKYYKEAGLM